MFHFTLVHVPGTHHGPDGLSRRRPQEGDEEEPEDDFEDWIDQVNGFIHFINPIPPFPSTITASPPITSYITDTDRQASPDLQVRATALRGMYESFSFFSNLSRYYY
jgi:hypothetical protein